MEITIKLPRIEITGRISVWNENDPGIKQFAGSVFFDNDNYLGFIRHDGYVELIRNGRKIGAYWPSNMIQA